MKKHSIKFVLIPALVMLAEHAHGALIAHYMEQSSSPIIDHVGGETAAATGSGHVYSVTGPSGWGNAVGLDANGSWQLDVTESAELRALPNNFTVAAGINIEDSRFGKAYATASNNPRFDRIIGDDAAWNGDGWAFGIENRNANTGNCITSGSDPCGIGRANGPADSQLFAGPDIRLERRNFRQQRPDDPKQIIAAGPVELFVGNLILRTSKPFGTV